MNDNMPQKNIPPFSVNNLKKIRSLHLKKYRDAEQAFLAEGARLCEEALASNVRIRQAVTAVDAMQNKRIAAIAAQCRQRNIAVFQATAAQFDSLSEEQSPQGIAFVIEKPRRQVFIGEEKLALAVDHLQDPGNLGTILRSAEWFGVNHIVLSGGSVDAFNAKVVRGSMGAIFRLAIEEDVDLATVLAERKSLGWRIIGADAGGEPQLPDVKPSEKDILVIGNEGAGLDPDIVELLDVAVAIPGSERGESLNAAVAGSIFMYHFTLAKESAGAAERE